MARYNTVTTTNSVASASPTISAPQSGLLTTFNSGASGTVTLPNPVLYPGFVQTFFNNSGVTLTFSTPSGSISGPGYTSASSQTVPDQGVFQITSDGAGYTVTTHEGGPLVATTGVLSSTFSAVGVTTTGTLAVNASGGITTNQTSFPIATSTATTITLGTAATTFSMADAATSFSLANTATAAQTFNLATANTASSTYNVFTGITASGSTKTINIGTRAASGATTAINLGSSSAPSTSTITLNGKLSFAGSSSGTVGFQAAATAGSVTYTWPSADAAVSGYALTSNGSGTLSWTAAGATISDDTSTTTLYPVMNNSASGTLTTARITSTKYTFNASTGTLSVTALTESSSIALKENVAPINNGLDLILQLAGVTYDRKDGSRKNEAGLIAEDVADVIPNIVTYSEEGKPEGINYTKLTAYLVEAVKSLKAEINALKGI
jgi:hypothetical protein